jgi:hypothetical protein
MTAAGGSSVGAQPSAGLNTNHVFWLRVPSTRMRIAAGSIP